MNKLKQLQISESTWKQLKEYCQREGYTIKGFVEKTIKHKIDESKDL